MRFDLSGKVAVITGGGGVLCSTIAEGLAREGVRCVILDIAEDKAEAALERVKRAGSDGLALKASVLDRGDLERAADETVKAFGRVDFLINGAGGNHPKATTSAEVPFFELPEDAVRFVFDLNFMGTFLASQVFGRVMAERKEGVILNIASMNALRPLTRIPAYSAAKAAVANFTQWLAVHMAQEYSPKIRRLHRPGVLPDRTEPVPAPRRAGGAYRTGQKDHRPHPHGAFRRPRGPHRGRGVALVPRCLLRHGGGDSHRRGLLRLFRGLTFTRSISGVSPR